MKKYTTEEFDRFLDSFRENNVAVMHSAVRLITSNGLWSELCSEICNYRKQSLVRKVLRYVAETALQGTFEIDGLAQSCAFHDMRNGMPVSFGTNTEWSFTHKGQKINVEIANDVATFYDTKHNTLKQVEIPSGCHWCCPTGKIDLIQMFER